LLDPADFGVDLINVTMSGVGFEMSDATGSAVKSAIYINRAESGRFSLTWNIPICYKVDIIVEAVCR
jgi:hypothetical protein